MIFLSTLIKGIIALFLLGFGFHYFSQENKYQQTLFQGPGESFDIKQTLHHEQMMIKNHKLGNWAPIEIIADYSNLQVNSTQLEFVQNRLINYSISYLKTLLTVYPRNSKTVSSAKCGSFQIPSSIRAATNSFDLAIIVVGTNNPYANWYMRGISCELDGTTNRPVLGTFEINLERLSGVDLKVNQDEEWELWQQQALHEFIHLLAFNSVLYPFYINPQTNKVLGVDNVVRVLQGKKYIQLPQVIARVKAQFDCNAAVGALLEDGGGDEIAGFHWERVTFGNEIMTGRTFPDAVLSVITLSLLEGTGWYNPNYQYAQQYFWGYQQGCGQTQGTCAVLNPFFCKASNETSGCSSDYYSISGCMDQDDLAGSCKYYREYLGGDCRYNSVGSDLSDGLSLRIGGSIGLTSRCFTTTLPKAANIAGYTSGCFQSKCVNGQAQFVVGDQTYTCNTPGALIAVKYNNITGTVTCPSQLFCQQFNNCPNQCINQGTCVQNNCKCWNGYKGNDCSQKV